MDSYTGRPPESIVADGSQPMKLRATDTPSAKAGAFVPLMAIEAATASTRASTSPVDLAVIVTSPTLLAAVPSEPPVTDAVVVDSTTLVDSAPPPDRATAGVPAVTDAANATAIALTRISESLVAVIVTAPPAFIVPAFSMNAATVLSTVLCASARPTEPAPLLPPDRLAVTAAAIASAVIFDESVASTASPPVPASTPVLEAEASMSVAMRLSVHSPPMATAAASVVDAAMATEAASTKASITDVDCAEIVTPLPALSEVFTACALTSIALAPPHSSQPMRLRATETPMATPAVILSDFSDNATAAETAATVAVMAAELVVLMAIAPAVASTEPTSAIFAMVSPAIRLTADAPPPLNAVALPDALADTLIADAVEVASIALAWDADTVMFLLALTMGTFLICALVSVRMSLRAMLIATVTATAPLFASGLVPISTATAIAGALTVEVMVALSVAVTVRLPPASTLGAPSMIAWVFVATLFMASTGSIAIDFRGFGSSFFLGSSLGFSAGFLSPSSDGASGGFGSVEIATVSRDDFTCEVMAAAVSAVTEMSPPAVIGVPVTDAVAAAGCCSPTIPSSASMKLNSTFWAFQPTVLKARVTPTPTPGAWVLAVISAERVEVFLAATTTAPAVAVISLSTTVAVALLTIAFVTTRALRLGTSPANLISGALSLSLSLSNLLSASNFSSMLEPVAWTTTLLRSFALMVAVSKAVTETPAGAVTVIFEIFDVTPPRRSLWTNASPMPAPSTPPERNPPIHGLKSVRNFKASST